MVFVFNINEHLDENVVQHIHHDAIPCEFVLRGATDAACLYLVDVSIIHSHQSEAFPFREFTDAEFLAL